MQLYRKKADKLPGQTNNNDYKIYEGLFVKAFT